ncbi:MAG: divalent cation tolerance protein CutA [Bacteroidota bacterium]
MIVIHILCSEKSEAETIIELLIEEQLIWNATISKKTFYEEKDKERIGTNDKFLITAKTRSLLFQSVNHLLRDIYKDHMPLLYCIPIVYMDPQQSDMLLKQTLKI